MANPSSNNGLSVDELSKQTATGWFTFLAITAVAYCLAVIFFIL